jgi:hypothetical protein
MPRCPTYSFREHLQAQARRPERLPEAAPLTAAPAPNPRPTDRGDRVGPAGGGAALSASPQVTLLGAHLAPTVSRAQTPPQQNAAPAFFDDRLMPW